MDFKLEETYNMVSLDFNVSKKSLLDIKLFQNIFDNDGIVEFKPNELTAVSPDLIENEGPKQKYVK